MPALVGGFGNKKSLKVSSIMWLHQTAILQKIDNILSKPKTVIYSIFKNSSTIATSNYNSNASQPKNLNKIYLGEYLAGLIEGDGTFAVHDKNSTAKKYRPMIIIVFKKEDLPLAHYLNNITNCGSVQLKSNRGYVLWQISDIVGVYTIVNLINGHMRTPKMEALNRTID